MELRYQTSSSISICCPSTKGSGIISQLFWALLVTLLFVGSTQAQVDRSGLTGTVKDESGAAVPGVKIVVVQTATDLRREAVTSGTGTYSIPNLPVGSYTVSFTHAAFAELGDRGIKVSVIIPGLVDTELIPNNKRLDRELMLTPDDVAAAVLSIVKSPARVCPVEVVLHPQRRPERTSERTR